MDRKNFIKLGKSALICLSVGRSTLLDQPQCGNISKGLVNGNKFPDKSNYLVEATCLFATPANKNMDGKNGDDSYVDVVVDIESYDKLYIGNGGFGDGTEIQNDVILPMSIHFDPVEMKSIFLDGVKNINLVILGHKPNQSGGVNDKWHLRYEFYLRFKKGQILSTGYSEPAIEYQFSVAQTQINFPTNVKGRKQFWNRNELKTEITFKHPVG